MQQERPRILVIRRRYLGDIVLLGIFFRSLRRHWPDATLHVLVEEQYADVLALNPDVNGAFRLPKKSSSIGKCMKLLRDLRKADFTHVLDLDNTEKTAVLARLTGAPFRAVLHLRDRP